MSGDPEFLSPSPWSPSRHASLPSAIFSLVSTIIGGGVLSIPFAFANTGILLGCIFLVVIAAASDFSIYILMSCSRRVEGGKTYEEVVQRAFGGCALTFVVVLLFSLIYLCCVAYLILIRDLLGPIVEITTGITNTHTHRVLVVFVVLLFLLPLCLQRSLHALRFTSLTSFLSVLLLAITITYRTLQRSLGWFGGVPVSEASADAAASAPVGVGVLLWWSPGWHEAVYAFPIMSVAYLCHFNVLPIHGDLIIPTRTRIKTFVHCVIVVCTALYLEIGIMGYWYAREKTCGNILNNFGSDDVLISVGRVGLGFTCCCSFPLLVLPCRAVANRLIHIATQTTTTTTTTTSQTYTHNNNSTNHTWNKQHYTPIKTIQDEQEQHDMDQTHTAAAAQQHIQQLPLQAQAQAQARSQAQAPIHRAAVPRSVDVESAIHPAECDSLVRVCGSGGGDVEVDVDVSSSWFVSEPSLVIQTIAIVGSAFLFSCVVGSVAVMWSILGSTVSILIAYIIPAACYIQIRGRRQKRCNLRVLCAWLLLVLGVLCLILCTYQAVQSLRAGQAQAP